MIRPGDARAARRRSQRPRAVGASLLLVLATTLALTTSSAPVAGDQVTFTNATAHTLPAGGASAADHATSDRYPSTVTVSGVSGRVLDARVTLTGLSHDNVSDLDVLLVAPNGSSVALMSDVGGDVPVSGLDLTFSDAAASGASDSALTSGTYRPSNLANGTTGDVWPLTPPGAPSGSGLSVFDGIGPNGNWSLFITDDTSGAAGQLAGGWSLLLETATASAGGPYTAVEGSAVTLSASTSPVIDGATFAWDVDGDGQFDDATGAAPTLSAATLTSLGLGDGPDASSVRVQASAGAVVVASATTLTITGTAPTATFSNDGPVTVGDEAHVAFTDQADASAADTAAGFRYSYDLDDDGTWDIGDGTYAGGVTEASATVPASVLSAPGDHDVEGRIVDDDGDQTSDTTTITVEAPANQPPVADAGPDQTVGPRTLVTLDGTGSSDPDGDDLTYLWLLIDGPGATLSDDTSATPTFTTPAGPQEYLFELQVRDSGDLIATDSVTVTVTNQPPVADAGPDQRVNPGDLVTLDFSGSSDPDGDRIRFQVSLVEDVELSAISSTPTSTTFRAPAGPATLTFVIRAIDEGRADSFDTVVVTVNGAPTADAGPDQAVNGSDTVTLDGSGSSDPLDDELTFAWTQTGGPTVELSDTTSASPTFTAPAGPAVLTFDLAVTDDLDLSDTDSVTVTVNGAPVADAGADAEVVERQTATLDGTGSSDPDGDDLTYAWTQDSGPAVELVGADTATATFTVPDGVAPLVFTLTVDDGNGGTATDSVTVTPLARLTPDESFIDHTYRVLLGRESGAVDRAYWVERLAAGATRTLVARQIGLSAEATRGEVLDDRYERWLGRLPSSADRDFWAPRLLSGEPIQVLEVSVLASAERYAIGGTDAEYIRLLYEALLRRGPNPAEAEFWLDRLAAVGRPAVARGILTSTESERIRVEDAYVEVLDRPADAAGRGFWVGVLDRTGDLRRVEIGLAAAWVPSTRSSG